MDISYRFRDIAILQSKIFHSFEFVKVSERMNIFIIIIIIDIGLQVYKMFFKKIV